MFYLVYHKNTSSGNGNTSISPQTLLVISLQVRCAVLKHTVHSLAPQLYMGMHLVNFPFICVIQLKSHKLGRGLICILHRRSQGPFPPTPVKIGRQEDGGRFDFMLLAIFLFGKFLNSLLFFTGESKEGGDTPFPAPDRLPFTAVFIFTQVVSQK